MGCLCLMVGRRPHLARGGRHRVKLDWNVDGVDREKPKSSFRSHLRTGLDTALRSVRRHAGHTQPGGDVYRRNPGSRLEILPRFLACAETIQRSRLRPRRPPASAYPFPPTCFATVRSCPCALRPLACATPCVAQTFLPASAGNFMWFFDI